jgi:hypothetical protein
VRCTARFVVMVMSAGESRNLPGPLEQAETVYRDAAGQLPPVTPEMLAQRAGHFAAGVRLGLAEPQGIRRLHQVTGGLRDVSSLSALLPRVLDGALSLMGADFGNVQLRDPVTGSLRIVTQSGFDSRFLDYFAVVDDDHSAWGRAAREGAQIVITDVNTDPGFAPHREIAAASGFRAVQSTPLADHAGRLVGMVSTHFRRPHRPASLDLRILELYADFAGQAIAGHLGMLGDGGLGDPVGREMISALLDPGDGQVSNVIALPGPGASRGSRGRGPVRAAASLKDTMPEFAGYVVNRLFSVGLSLESAHSIVGKGPAGDRIAAATDEVDRMIRDIRTTTFRLATDPLALLDARAARTARALQAAALDAAALLERQADLARQPGRLDYQAEIKRWRAFAEQAEQMARRWEQRP